jgi:hypothetical protein
VSLPATTAHSCDLPEYLMPSRREAILHAGGLLLIIAGPGSGKTEVITCGGQGSKILVYAECDRVVGREEAWSQASAEANPKDARRERQR